MSFPITVDDIGKIVSFNLYPAAILQSSYNNVKVLGILDAASTFPFFDPVSMHANVYPTLPPGTPNRYDGYLYAKVQFPDGTVTAVGLPWINGAITVHENITIKATIVDSDASKVEILRQALIANGFVNFTIEQVNN